MGTRRYSHARDEAAFGTTGPHVTTSNTNTHPIVSPTVSSISTATAVTTTTTTTTTTASATLPILVMPTIDRTTGPNPPQPATVAAWAVEFGAVMPLPPLVAAGAAAFRDWTAWAVALLRPPLWRQHVPYAWPALPAASPPEPAALVRALVAAAVARVERAPDPTKLPPALKARVRSTAKTQMQRTVAKVTALRVVDLVLAMHAACARHGFQFHPPVVAGIARTHLPPLWAELDLNSDLETTARLLEQAIARVECLSSAQLVHALNTTSHISSNENPTILQSSDNESSHPNQMLPVQQYPVPSPLAQVGSDLGNDQKSFNVADTMVKRRRRSFETAIQSRAAPLSSSRVTMQPTVDVHPDWSLQSQCLPSGRSIQPQTSRLVPTTLPTSSPTWFAGVPHDIADIEISTDRMPIDSQNIQSSEQAQRLARGSDIVRHLQAGDWNPSSGESDVAESQHSAALMDTRPAKRPRSVSLSLPRKAQLRAAVLTECNEVSRRHGSVLKLDISEEFGLPIVVCQVLVPELKLPRMVLRVASGYCEGITGASFGFERPPLGWTGLLYDIRAAFHAEIVALPTSSITVAMFIDAWTRSVLYVLENKT